MKQEIDMKNIPQELFTFAEKGNIHDKKFETKPIGYFKDAFRRFSKNKGSVIAGAIIGILVLFAIIGPYCYSQSYIDSYSTSTELKHYQYLKPKLKIFKGTGFWDGTKRDDINEAKYDLYKAMEIENGYPVIVKDFGPYTVNDNNGAKTMYDVRVDTYHSLKVFKKTFSKDDYLKVLKWQDENNMHVILPYVDYYKADGADWEKNSEVKYTNDPSIWYQCNEKGYPVKDADGNFINGYRRYNGSTVFADDYTSIRYEGDPGKADPNSNDRYCYAMRSITSVTIKGVKTKTISYSCRINPYNYFIYLYGFEPCFKFGSDANGYDVFTRLASGARFSMIFALCVSAINLFVGAIYGAVEGYYGGNVDIVMERISDILASLPTMVITVLFNLHLTGKVGVIPALLFAFIATGWIGMASTVRMQFYRFKNQEYVLAARTLGASDKRIMFKHIFPNSLGTIITSTVLVIPGVIFSETSLTYLGIINLDSSTRSSVGAMLSSGQGVMTTYPFLVFFPALFIGLLEVCFNLFGNGLRDAFNPSLRGSED